MTTVPLGGLPVSPASYGNLLSVLCSSLVTLHSKLEAGCGLGRLKWIQWPYSARKIESQKLKMCFPRTPHEYVTGNPRARGQLVRRRADPLSEPLPTPQASHPAEWAPL